MIDNKPKCLFRAVFVLAVLFSAANVQSQSNLYYYQQEGTWDFGPKVGFTTSIINTKGPEGLKSGVRLGLVGGFFARYQIASQWGLHGDISYSSSGNKSDDGIYKNDYIDIAFAPVYNVKYRMFKKDMTFDIFAGAGVSFLTKAEFELGELVLDNSNFINDTSINIIAGGSLPFGPFLLTATTRFGVKNLLTEPVPNSKWHSISTEWTAAYRF